MPSAALTHTLHDLPVAAARPTGRTPWWRLLFSLLLLTWCTACASLPPNTQRTASRVLPAGDGSALAQLLAAKRAAVGTTRSDSAFTLLEDVDAAFSARLALVDNAQRSLDLQYYAIHADASTEVLLRRIRAAAARGVRVRILMDDFNTVGADAQVLRLAFVPNVEVRLFNPLPGSRQSLVGRIVTSLHDVDRIQKRMHNKLFLADGLWGITGGRNLGDAYFGGDKKSAFVDLDVLAAGRVVRDMAASFDRYWNDELAYPVQTLLEPRDLEELRKPEIDAGDVAEAQRPALDLGRVTLTWAPAALLADAPGKIGPGDDEVNAGETVVDGLLTLLGSAQKDVLIISPYFVPGQKMMGVFAQLRQRNVRIRVLTNSLASNDAPAAHAGYARYRDRLLALGIEIHEMRSDPGDVAELLGSHGKNGSGKNSGSAAGGFLGSGPGGSKSATSRASLHSKAVVIDGRLAVIGSMNLDLRSKNKNSEVALVLRSPAIAQQAIAEVEHTFATASYRLEKKDGRLHWAAPPGAGFTDASDEPGASVKLKVLVKLLGPFAPEEML